LPAASSTPRRTRASTAAGSGSQEKGKGERLPQPDQLKRFPRRLVETADPSRHQVAQATPDRQLPTPTPEAELLHQHTPIETLENELAKDQRHPPARLPQHVLGPTFQLAPQHRFHERARLLTGERLQLEKGAMEVLPECSHGVRRRLTRTNRQQPDGTTLRDQAVHERRRSGIEQMGIVDTQHQHALPRTLSDSDLSASKHIERGRHTTQVDR
jgi:hypothetical protein